MGYPPTEILRDLIDGKLPWELIKSILSGNKDEDRFDKYVKILQERVSWPEKILLPFQEHLYIVEKEGKRLVKCDCGYEFGDYRENWKLKAVMDLPSDEELDVLYPGYSKLDNRFCEMRRYYCPGCGTLLEVETLPQGHPIIFDFLPDLDAFYKEWLGSPLETDVEFKDLSYQLVEKWAGESS